MAFKLVNGNQWNSALKLFNMVTDIRIGDLIDFTPTRSTTNSAGYDFKMPFNYTAKPGRVHKIPTGFKWSPANAYIRARVHHPEEYDSEKKLTDSDDPFENSIFIKTVDLRVNTPVLMLFPRSSFGFNYGFRLVNTTGIIDADYYNNIATDGHIVVGFTVDKELEIKRGDKFCQGVILPFMYDGDDQGVTTIRTGGIGSTDESKD